MIASARQTNEELWLLATLKAKLGAVSDSVPRVGAGDKLLVSADKNPNASGAQLTGIAADPMGSQLPKLPTASMPAKSKRSSSSARM